MVKAVGIFNGNPTIVLGLSHANLDRLRADGLSGGIKVRGADFGLSHDILITAGETEIEIASAMSHAVTSETRVHIDPKLKQ